LKEQILQAFIEVDQKLTGAATTVATRTTSHEKDWGPREILAHIAAWEAEALHRIPLLEAGASSKTYDADAFNAEAVSRLGNQSFEQVLESFHQTHHRLLNYLASLDDTAFASDGAAYEWVTALIRHSLEHVQELDSVV